MVDEADIQKIRNIIINTPISSKLRNLIADQIQKYSSTVNFAVRSSAAVEDSDDYSWAGQFDSFLNISNSINLIEIAIKRVWASTFNYRSISYCNAIEIASVKGLRMSVIIQEMVDNPDFSGVLFTNNPIEKNDNSIYIEYTEGYGDKLVSGTINPYKITISRNNIISNADTDSIIEPDIIKLLKDKSIVIEKIYNKPQDIEWSISNGKLVFLQSRPITSLHNNKDESINVAFEPIIKGVPVSSGIGVGKSIIIHNIHDASNIKKGDVIIAPMTNPDMVPYMRNSTAIVTDVGGMICHTAIVAREMNIPCIVGTSNATKIIKAGEIITVDGNSGHVYKGNVKIDSKAETIPDIITDISELYNKSFNKENVLYYNGIGKISSVDGYNKVIINPYFFDQQVKFNKVRNISLEEQNIKFDKFISNIQQVVESSNCEIEIFESDVIKELPDYKFIQANNHRIVFLKNKIPSSNDHFNRLTKFTNSKNFFGHIPQIVSEGYPYPPRMGPWWSENWKYGWKKKSINEKISWGNIRPEIVNTPFTKSLIVQGIEKIPLKFNYEDLGPLYTKWKNCRVYIDIKKLDKIRFKLSDNYVNNIQSFLEYIEQLHLSYNEWDVQTKKERKEFERNKADNKLLMDSFKVLWKIHEDFFALCFLIQTIGDDIIWPRIQSFLSEVYEILGVKENLGYSSQITKVLASPPEKTLSKIYLEDLMRLKREKINTEPKNMNQWEEKLKQHLDKWHWMRDRDLYYPPISTPEKVELLLGKMELMEPASDMYWYTVFEENVRILKHFNLSDWFIDLIIIGNHLHIERENHHLIWVRNVDLMREIIQKIGANFQKNKIILSKDDIFFIQLPEIIAVIENDDYSLIKKETIDNRKKAFMYESKSQEIEKDKLFKEIDYY